MRCATCVITRGVSSIRVSSRRLAVPLQDMDFERHATLLFCAKSANVQGNGAEKEENDKMSTNVEGFLSGLSERMWKENDLSDVTYALCVGNVEFRQFFLDFFFRKANLCATEVDISREWCDGEGNRPDFCIRGKDGKHFFVEVKLWDGNLHFESYSKGLQSLNGNMEFAENLAYIAAYKIDANVMSGCNSIHTWYDFYKELEQLSFLNDSVIKGYGGYIYAVAGLHDESQADSDIREYKSFNPNDFVAVRNFMKSLDSAIANYKGVDAYTRSDRCFRRGCRMGRFFEVKNFKDGLSVWGWIGAYYNYGDPEICVWFEDRPGWGKLVCDRFRDEYSGNKPVTDTWYYEGEGGNLYFYMLDSDKDISTFFNRVLEKIRSDNTSSSPLNNDDLKKKYKPLLSMRRFPLWIERNFFNNLQIDDCVVIVDASGDSEDPYNHCGRYFTIEKQLKQNCGGKKQQLKGWVGVLFGENENAIDKPQVELQFLRETGRYECADRLGTCGSGMVSIAHEFENALAKRFTDM